MTHITHFNQFRIPPNMQVEEAIMQAENTKAYAHTSIFQSTEFAKNPYS